MTVIERGFTHGGGTIYRRASLACAELMASLALSPPCLGPVLVDADVCRAALENAARERVMRSACRGTAPPDHPERGLPAMPLTETERLLDAELRRPWWRRNRERAWLVMPAEGAPR